MNARRLSNSSRIEWATGHEAAGWDAVGWASGEVINLCRSGNNRKLIQGTCTILQMIGSRENVKACRMEALGFILIY